MGKEEINKNKTPVKPADFEEVEKNILANKKIYNSASAKIGFNKGQLIVRIPSSITRQLNLKSGFLLDFTIEESNNEKKLVARVVPRGSLK